MSAAGAAWRRRSTPWAVALAAAALVLVVHALVTDAPRGRLAAGEVMPGDPAGARVSTGYLALPRGGPYVLGFISPGPGRLTVDGGDLPTPWELAGRGVVTRRVLLGARPPNLPGEGGNDLLAPARWVHLRLAAPAGARLLWIPPGRRSDPEYVPAGALSPAPPSSSADADRSLADAIAIDALALIALALAGWLVRRRLRALPRPLVVAFAAVLAVALVVRLESLGAAGQTWDENTYWSAGRDHVADVLAGHLEPSWWQWNYQHPPVSKYLAGLGAWWSGDYGPARAVSALVMALACATLVPIGARLHRLATGVAAGLVAAFTPHLVAHGQIVGHEAPTALAWALAWWASLRVWDGVGPRAEGGDERAVTRRLVARLAGVGVVLGVALMIRFVNVLAAPAIGLTVVALAPADRRRQAIALGLAVVPLVAVATSIALWPRLWWHPLAHLSEAWDKLKGTHSAEPFLGTLTATPPRWYFLAYLGATAPLGLALAALVGVGGWARARRRSLALVGLWAAAPLAVMLSPVRQDGVRYVIPTVVALSLLAGAGVVVLGEVAARWRARALAAPAAVLVVYLVIVCARIRPYYLDYYGEQVGGTAAVARTRRFEVAWWGEGLEDAIDHVNRHAAPGDRVHRACVEPSHLTWFRGDLWEPVTEPRAARWLVHYQPSWRPCPIPPGAKPVHTVRAGGAPLAIVYRIAPEVGP